jgi:hypothetical protein
MLTIIYMERCQLMSKRAKIDQNRVRKYRRAMAHYLTGVTVTELVSAAQWYVDAYTVAADVAWRMNVPLEHGAAIVSAFSPRVHWSRNITLAIDYASGRTPGCLRQSIRAADRATAQGFDGLRADKTNSFARAIAGDEEAVVVDVWMSRAARINRDAPTRVQYREISSAVRSLAREWKVAPRTMQALIWIKVRGKVN